MLSLLPGCVSPPAATRFTPPVEGLRLRPLTELAALVMLAVALKMFSPDTDGIWGGGVSVLWFVVRLLRVCVEAGVLERRSE